MAISIFEGLQFIIVGRFKATTQGTKALSLMHF